MKFFADIKEETSKATAQLEAFKKDRNEKTNFLRNLNDKCAGLQSEINKKLEMLNTYHGYKVFLDDLRDKEVKDREAALRAKKLEDKRQQRLQQQRHEEYKRGFQRG